MKLFKITDTSGRTIYVSSFTFKSALQEFDETQMKQDSRYREQLISIEQITNYTGIPAFQAVKDTFNKINEDLKDHEGKRLVDNYYSSALYELERLINACLK